MEVISKKKRTRYFLRKSLYVDNTAVVADNGADLQVRLVEWKEIFGGLGLRVSLDSTVYGGALGRAAGKKTSRNKIGWDETEPTRHFCISRGERFAGTAARRWKFAREYKLGRVHQGKWKG